MINHDIRESRREADQGVTVEQRPKPVMSGSDKREPRESGSQKEK